MWRHREAMGCVAVFLGAQEGDDLAEDGVREAADVVIFFHGGLRRGHSVDSKWSSGIVSIRQYPAQCSPLTGSAQLEPAAVYEIITIAN